MNTYEVKANMNDLFLINAMNREQAAWHYVGEYVSINARLQKAEETDEFTVYAITKPNENGEQIFVDTISVQLTDNSKRKQRMADLRSLLKEMNLVEDVIPVLVGTFVDGDREDVLKALGASDDAPEGTHTKDAQDVAKKAEDALRDYRSELWAIHKEVTSLMMNMGFADHLMRLGTIDDRLINLHAAMDVFEMGMAKRAAGIKLIDIKPEDVVVETPLVEMLGEAIEDDRAKKFQRKRIEARTADFRNAKQIGKYGDADLFEVHAGLQFTLPNLPNDEYRFLDVSDSKVTLISEPLASIGELESAYATGSLRTLKWDVLESEFVTGN